MLLDPIVIIPAVRAVHDVVNEYFTDGRTRCESDHEENRADLIATSIPATELSDLSPH